MADITTSCYAKKLPVLCDGCRISGGQYVEPHATYSLGKLQAIIPSYDPANTTLAARGYTLEDIKKTWTPRVYHMSGGVIQSITSETVVVSGGVQAPVCGVNGYNPRGVVYDKVSWYQTAVKAATNG